ncbi:hypothetical protein HID58_060050 [Brassica napus]|uniref:Uncharacterized protein n=1 Tax=Brassica napus TaxID=3708 RepID=A0ABQ7ZUL4_BRANA|nr:hypothetical protein HID58_060050 [Brassica napus]
MIRPTERRRRFRVLNLLRLSGDEDATGKGRRPPEVCRFLGRFSFLLKFDWTVLNLIVKCAILCTYGACQEVNDRVPVRIFPTDRFSSRRLNNYSKVDYLLFVRDVLEGSPDMDRWVLVLGSYSNWPLGGVRVLDVVCLRLLCFYKKMLGCYV